VALALHLIGPVGHAVRKTREKMKYELHPLCTLFPRVTGAEFDALVSDIKANGLRSPIVLHGGMVLDGGNRYRACLDAGVEPRFVEFEGGSVVAFVLSANLHRRHLSAGQQAAIVASAQDWAQAQPASRPEKAGNVTGLSTVADRAAQSGASDKTQRMADKVAKASPELAKQVAHGEISLPKAVEQISPKPKRELAPVIESDQAQELAEAHHAIGELAQEVEQLKDRLAVENMDASEDAKTEAAEIIEGLRAQVAGLERELDAMRLSRDSFQRENAELKKQITSITRQLRKAEA
jgi:FtsZ-binding cell division protein ZapB